MVWITCINYKALYLSASQCVIYQLFFINIPDIGTIGFHTYKYFICIAGS